MSLVSARVFVLLTGFGGVLGVLTLALISVYAGAAASALCQQLCFGVSLLLAPAGALLQLALGSGASDSESTTVMVAHALSDAAAAAVHSVGSSTSSASSSSSASEGPSLYLCGLLLSSFFALFNLCHNKHQQVPFMDPHGPDGPSRGGGYIPGRDDATTAVAGTAGLANALRRQHIPRNSSFSSSPLSASATSAANSGLVKPIGIGNPSVAEKVASAGTPSRK